MHFVLILLLRVDLKSIIIYFAITVISIHEGLDGGSWYSLITKNLAIYSLSLKFWLIH